MVNKKIVFRVGSHLLFWIAIWMVPLVLLPIVEPWERDLEDSGVPLVFYIVFLTGCFYFNLFILYPRYFVPKKTVRYIILAIALGLVTGIIYCLIFYKQIPGPFIIHVILKTTLALVFIACSTVYKVILDSLREQRLRQTRENENLKTELSFLRSQISPHFMFNVLNTIVALIRQKSDKLEPVVIELSNLMRYMLYESDEESVSLKTELEYLHSYIDIQMHRFGENIKLIMDIPQHNGDQCIEPMLLIPLVENAFKHGYGVIQNPEIALKLVVENDVLKMDVRNKFVENAAGRFKNSGIGLNNLRRRLNLLYPEAHELIITKNDCWFEVKLLLVLRKEAIEKKARGVKRYVSNTALKSDV